MKRIISFLSIPVLALAASCSQKLEIEFAHEKQAFETRSNMILLECIMPQASTQDEEIYIIGDFNGGEAAIGNPDYLMTHSDVITSKWGIYLDPSRFQGGKTLADGFTFYSVQQGLERGPKNEDVLHKLTIGPGEWANVYVDKWAKYFAPPENPDEVVLPEHDGVRVYIIDQTGWDAIALYMWGDVNNFGGDWPGAQVAGTWTCKGQEYKYFEYGGDIFGLNENLIFNNNNGGTQLSDYNMTFADGVKDYFLLVTADGVSEAEDPTGGGGVVIPAHDGVRVWVDDQSGWDAIALYMWGDVNNFGGDWPGAQVAGSETIAGVEYKYFEYGDDIYGLAENLIFNNNNNGTQLADYNLTFEDGVQDYFFQVTADGATLLEGPGGGGGSVTPEPPVEETKDPVKVYVQDLTGWEAVNLYMWGDKELCGGWPGLAPAEKTVKIGTVSYKVFTVEDALGRSENLIFNGDGGQSPDVPLTLEAETFIRLEVVDGALVATVIDPRNPDIKILVNNKTDWDAISLYAWGDAEAFGGWPGATPVAYEEVKGVTYTVFGLPADMAGKTLNLIFNNNGGGKQLADFAITVPEQEMFLNINANYYVDNVDGNPRGDDSYIYVIDGMGWGDNLHMYAWGASEIFGGWPGAAGEAVGTFCGVPGYRFFVGAEHSGKEEHLIFNNGNGGDGNQFDGPAVVVGENLWYGIASDFTWTTAEPAVRVYVEDNTGWDALYVYSWGTGEIFGGWPGVAVSGTQEIGGKTWKYAEIPASSFGWTANLIFNNNNGTQLENFDVLKGQQVGRDFYFTLTGDNVAAAE